MSPTNTELCPNTFPTTRWTLVRDAGQGDNPEGKQRAAEALESLCRDYRSPILAFVKRQVPPHGDADDIVQEFLANFVHQGGFTRADAAKGRLRSYLLTSIRHFLIDWHRRNSAEKRGGGVPDLVLETYHEPAGNGHPDDNEPAGQHAYDKTWATLVMDRAIETLLADYCQRGRETLCADLLTITNGHSDSVDARESIRLRHDLSDNALRVELHRYRERLGRSIRQIIAATVSDPDQVEEELRYLGRLWIA